MTYLTAKVRKDTMAVEEWIQPAIRWHQFNFHPVQHWYEVVLAILW